MAAAGEVREAASATATVTPLDGDIRCSFQGSSTKTNQINESRVSLSYRSVHPILTSPVEVPATRGSRSIVMVAQNSVKAVMVRALVVDDAELSRKMTIRVLETLSVECEEAVDGAEAIAKVREGMKMPHNFSMVMIDYEMPHVSGPAAGRTIGGMDEYIHIYTDIDG